MFPYIPLDVLLALSKQFPERAPQSEHETHTATMWRGGQVSVVRFLQRIYDEQNILSPEDDAQDVPSQP